MRRIFNEARFEERVRKGELTEKVTREKTINPEITKVGENVPLESTSQGVRYFDKRGNEICRAHRYIKPDGTIGGKGKTDPKRIFVNPVHYRLQKEGKPTEPLTEKEFRSILAKFELTIGTHEIGSFNDITFSVRLNNRGEVDLELTPDGKRSFTIFYTYLDRCGFIYFSFDKITATKYRDIIIAFREKKKDLHDKAMQDVSSKD
jgi:hypothetical protein